MKGFTLVEIAVIMLITLILAGISLTSTVFTGDTLYLKNTVYKLVSNINLIKDFALTRKEVGLQNKACGYGILISSTTNGYFGYAVATSSPLDCDFIATTTPLFYAPSSSGQYYLHFNGEIRQNPIEELQVKDNFQPNLTLKISTSSENCSVGNLFSDYQQIALVYYNPYSDVLLLGYNPANNWVNLSENWQNIYFCFEYKNEKRYFNVNRSGQVLVNQP